MLPPYLIGPFVHVQIGFDPWPAWFMVQMMKNSNFVWQKTLNSNVANVCTPSNAK